ncbi:hypothetical protein [Glycocaulis sp.]|uniref:hypothetical protein n=1 Tax=Glycocaulis sp. TaxID=1969725 RepID=UPI003F6F4837
MNQAISEIIASYAFLISIISVLLAVGGVVVAVTVHARAKKSEVECARLELMYKLMQNGIGMGDARRLRTDGQPGFETFVPSQIAALAALRAFPELLPVFERLEPNFRQKAEHDPDDRNFDKTLHNEICATLEYIRQSRK